MRVTEQQLMLCLGAYAAGTDASCVLPSEATQWAAFRELAAMHKLSAVAYETLQKSPAFYGGDEAMAAGWRQDALRTMAGQVRRTQALLALADGFTAAEIPYLVMKGAVCRSLYSKPDLRPSGDEDLLVLGEDVPRCAEVLTSQGYKTENGLDEDVTHWHCAASGAYVELHRVLFDSQWPAAAALNSYFSSQVGRGVSWPVEQGTVLTMEPTAHFLFLVCHALKHFVLGGFGVRTICDIALYAMRYGAQIDWTALNGHLEAVRGRRFLDQLLEIGRRHWALELPAQWQPCGPLDPEPLLTDALAAGIYGQSSMSRRHSAGLVREAVVGNETNGLLRTLFPGKDAMAGRYPVLRRAPVLLPACWGHRLGCYALELLRHDSGSNSAAEALRLGKQRTEMMKYYGVIP